MPDELGKRGQRDRFRINVIDATELQAWCEEFDCTPNQLKTAVGRAGVMATDVLAYLKGQGPSDRRPRLRGRGVRAR
jgi:hypothetical protein